MSYVKHLLKKACERCEEGNLDTCDNTLSCPVYALYVEATKKEKVVYKQDGPKEKYYAEMDKVKELNKKVLELSNFACIKEEPRLFVYCDNCPIVETCIKLKEFSK